MKNNYFSSKRGKKWKTLNFFYSRKLLFFFSLIFFVNSICIFNSSWFITRSSSSSSSPHSCFHAFQVPSDFTSEWRKAHRSSFSRLTCKFWIEGNERVGFWDVTSGVRKMRMTICQTKIQQTQPWASSIKIYIWANNEKVDTWITNDSWIEETNHRRIMTKWFPWELVCETLRFLFNYLDERWYESLDRAMQSNDGFSCARNFIVFSLKRAQCWTWMRWV